MGLMCVVLLAGEAQAQGSGKSARVRPPSALEPALELTKPSQDAPKGSVGLISGFKVTGNERIDAATVVSYLPVSVGQAIDAAGIDVLVKTLYRTELFSDVQIALNGAQLEIAVVESPIINQVIFEGNSALTKDKLREEVQIRPRGVFTKAKVQADVQRIIELYRRSGRISATVSPKVVELPQKRVDLVFEINEGVKTGVASINFIGNKAFSDSELSGIIVTRKSIWWKFFSSNDNYDPDRIDYDREQLKKFYTNRGYYDFRIISSIAELTPDRKDFAISYTMDEGRKYNFGRVTVRTENDKLKAENLESFIPFRTGQLYESDKIEKAVDALTYAAGSAGFAFVDIQPRDEGNPDTRTVDVTFNVREGARVYVEKINILGNTATLDRVIRRQMRLSEGDAYNKALVERSKTYVQGLGFFKDVKIDNIPGSAPDKTSINVTVEEQPTGELSFGAGFSSYESFMIDIGIEQRNFRGTGQNLRTRISTGKYQKNIDFSFTEPRFMDRDVQAGIDIFSSSLNYRGVSYSTNSTGLGLRLGYNINGYSLLRLRYNLRSDKVTQDNFGSCDSLLYNCGTGTTSSVGYTLSLDKRNDFVQPTRGWLAILRQDVAGLGGNVSYVRSEGELRWYYGFRRDMILSISNTIGNIVATNSDGVRVNDRFYKGGDSMRGFQYAGIGPRDTETGFALGGQTYLITSAELGIPNGLPEQYGLKTALFLDVGTLGTIDKLIKNDASGKPLPNIVDDLSFRATAGLTIRWKSPMGPVQFDISQILKNETYDKTETFRFSQSTQF
jgi:outer membrane protein insertion porin family